MGEDSFFEALARSPEAVMVIGSAAVGVICYAAHTINRILNPKEEDPKKYPLYDDAMGITYPHQEEIEAMHENPAMEIPRDPYPEMSLRDAVEEGCPASVNGVIKEFHASGSGYSGWVSDNGYAVPFRAPDEEGERIVLDMLLENSLRTETPLRMQVQMDKSRNFLVWS